MSYQTTGPTAINWSSLLKAGVVTVIAAIVANLLVYALVAALITIPDGFDPFTPARIAILTFLGVVGAVIAFAVVWRFSTNPVRVFTVVAIIAFFVSILPNIIFAFDPDSAPVPNGTPTAFLLLIIFHVVAGIVAVAVLSRMTEA